MYNFWRWYPRGKVVFLAPTKPLVAQQINACHEIMGIPSEETIELTGNFFRIFYLIFYFWGKRLEIEECLKINL